MSLLIFFLPYFVIVAVQLLSLLSTAAGVVYYVKPTEPCAHNSSCPSNETCHTMDHYASNSSHYFSPDHINITLYFMCGVHNCTKHLDVSNLQKFSITGISDRKDVTIYMPITMHIPNEPGNDTGNCTYQFINVSSMRIENVTIFFISLNFTGKDCQLEVEHVNFLGYLGSMSPMVSVIYITYSQAMLNDCTFQQNCFIRIHTNTVLQVSDCTFSSYNHALYSAISVSNSSLKLTGNVTFINNTLGNDLIQYRLVCGGAISVNSGFSYFDEVPNSVFIITKAHVNFKNNTAINCGGAIHLRSTQIIIFNNVSMIFTSNTIKSYYNNGAGGGAMYLEQSQLLAENSVLQFFYNSAKGAAYGGAIYQTRSDINISEYSVVSFIGNTATSSLGGALYCQDRVSLYIDMCSNLLFYNNSAGQGGAMYVQLFGSIKIGSDSQVEFSSNTAMKFGGAIYVDDQTCLFTFNNSSSTVQFKNNLAKGGVGMNIYGASVKSMACMMRSLCGKNIFRYVPSLNSSLSSVSSNPKRVCLCDSNGKPQCANISSILVNRGKVYRGELFNISVVVVGYDFGVTIGTVNADFVPSHDQGHSKPSLHPSQYRQLIGSSEHVQCSNVSYNVYSLNNIQEMLQKTLCLHTSNIDVAYFLSKQTIERMINIYEYFKHTCTDITLLTTPVLINITLLSGCPPGFTLTQKDDRLYGCDCFPVLQNYNFKCSIINNAGYFKWKSTMWVNATYNKSESQGILLGHYCPLYYCKSGEKNISLGRNPNAQCANNHAGVLCGGCETNYSLAIGSSRCVKCSNDSHLLLFLFFPIAGFMLVIFILVLNVTVTQGLVNGLLLYANILWTYKDLLFPFKQDMKLYALQAFIA